MPEAAKLVGKLQVAHQDQAGQHAYLPGSPF
jgi:hypothetical protein